MHPNIKVIRTVLDGMGMSVSDIPGFPGAIMIGSHSFIWATTPFNDEAVSVLCHDKAATHAILAGKVRMPKTLCFVDPKSSHAESISAHSFDEILKKSLGIFYPRIVKMNQGERGINVFLARNDIETTNALCTIFEKNSRRYDYIALVQEYIEPQREIRVIVSNSRVAFAYDRETLSIVSGETFSNLEVLCAPILGTLALSWGAIDFIESKDGEFYFIEANTKPSFEKFISVHGDSLIQKIYTDALFKFFNRETALLPDNRSLTPRHLDAVLPRVSARKE